METKVHTPTSHPEAAAERGTDRDSEQAHDDRDESRMERLDRNTVELLNELRVASTGIQVLLAFLLVIPFNARFTRLTSFERGLYMGTLICIAIAAVLLIGPSIHHRLLFRQREKAYLVDTGSRLMVLSSIFLAIGLIGIMLLISELVVGGAGAIAIGVCAAVVVAGIWFGLPLNRRRRLG
jgi:Family of unknown function (DUF6328)